MTRKPPEKKTSLKKAGPKKAAAGKTRPPVDTPAVARQAASEPTDGPAVPPTARALAAEAAAGSGARAGSLADPPGIPVSGDALLTDHARDWWRVGDWSRLAALDETRIAGHPDRARLALLAAAGCFQTGEADRARRLVRRAQGWRCDSGLLARVLVSGVCNSLGRAAALIGNEARAESLFRNAIAIADPHVDPESAGRARHLHEKAGLGLLPEAATLFGIAVEALHGSPRPALDARLQQLEAVADLLRAAHSPAAAEPAPTPRLMRQVADLLDEADPHAALARAAADLSPVAQVRLWHAVSDRFRQLGNRMMAIDSLAEAETLLPSEAAALCQATVRRYLDLGHPELALRLLVDAALATAPLSDAERETLWAALAKGANSNIEHGHILLLDRLEADPPGPAPDGRRRLMIEVGTTRERIPGQGSTLKLAGFCAAHGLHLITVDMDPRNSALARRDFAAMGSAFEAITAPGEDYLEDFEGVVDYVFLDAYDFDHGKHSELRQSRYQAFLGSRIDEAECHRMHLRCARALVTRLAPDGLICIDDTWLDGRGAWTAKGTLAVPFLLENGFEIERAANRAVLMRRAVATPAH